jgi:hypothetical protein
VVFAGAKNSPVTEIDSRSAQKPGFRWGKKFTPATTVTRAGHMIKITIKNKCRWLDTVVLEGENWEGLGQQLLAYIQDEGDHQGCVEITVENAWAVRAQKRLSDKKERP